MLGCLVTTLELESDEPCRDSCGACSRCLAACPSGAIDGCGAADCRRCLSCLTIEYRGERLPEWVAAVKGEKALEKPREVLFATVERKEDGKQLVLRDDEKRTPVDIQATLSFSRGEPSELVVVPETAFKLHGNTYKVIEIKSAGKGAKVTIEDPLGKIRALEAVDQ